MPGAEAMTFEEEDRGFVYAIARKFVSTPADADDITQETLLLAFRHRAAFRGDSRYRTWLYRIAATTALGHLRRQRRARVSLVADDRERRLLERQVDPAKSPVALLEEAEAAAVMHRALAEMQWTYREVLLARSEAGELEVANQLGLSVANVKVRAHRARKQLRATIDRIEKSAA